MTQTEIYDRWKRRRELKHNNNERLTEILEETVKYNKHKAMPKKKREHVHAAAVTLFKKEMDKLEKEERKRNNR